MRKETCRECGMALSTITEENFGVCTHCYGKRAMQRDRNSPNKLYTAPPARRKNRFVC
jgi:hypothetical protein